jgi:hypothetical protein
LRMLRAWKIPRLQVLCRGHASWLDQIWSLEYLRIRRLNTAR